MPVLTGTKNMAQGHCDYGLSQVHCEVTSLGTVGWFLPHFFYTRLTNVGHRDPDIDGKYHYQAVRTWVKNKFGKGMKVSDMTTLVVFENREQSHWVCYGIFLK